VCTTTRRMRRDPINRLRRGLKSVIEEDKDMHESKGKIGPLRWTQLALGVSRRQHRMTRRGVGTMAGWNYTPGGEEKLVGDRAKKKPFHSESRERKSREHEASLQTEGNVEADRIVRRRDKTNFIDILKTRG